MDSIKIKKNDALLGFAKKLRQNMTPQEKKLWYDFLSKYPIKVYRQRIIDNYIADFYCAKAKLVILLDGSLHYTADGKEYDIVRTDVLQKYGLTVLRFKNNDVDNKFNGVCSVIDRTIKERIEKSIE
ncbi:MAG: endonuclease domain-containing protein [Clostridia bacterium]|nr:endonuclease domain-containing protein [Clostridia bacterium]